MARIKAETLDHPTRVRECGVSLRDCCPCDHDYEPRCAVVGIEIRTSIESSVQIVLRRGEMMQVISNLIANSIYAMPEGGILSISLVDAEGPADGIVLAIQDNGSGIAFEALPKVFDAFFTTRSAVGTGIRLFVAKQFVEGHGGPISMESSTSSRDHELLFVSLCPVERLTIFPRPQSDHRSGSWSRRGNAIRKTVPLLL